MIDEVVGGYHIERLLGEGGMGSVYVGRHEVLGRRAAIKILKARLSDDREMVQRFFNEAKTTTAIAHPGIVQVFDFGYHESGRAYIVMEYLRGESLGTRLRARGVLAPNEALRFSRQIASALAAAHAAGVLHRDLKPENIFLVPDPDVDGGERAKLLDFGIAKLIGESHTQLTESGYVIGTPIYMSPEQCRAAPDIDGRSDMYSLGCLMFHLLAGRPPFDEPSAGELIAAHLREPAPNLRELAPGIDADIARVVACMLEKAPADRFADMGEVGTVLDGVAATGSIRATPARTAAIGFAPTLAQTPAGTRGPRRSRWIVAAAVLAIAGAGVVIAYAFTRDDSTATVVADAGTADAATVDARAVPAADATAPVRDAAGPDAFSVDAAVADAGAPDARRKRTPPTIYQGPLPSSVLRRKLRGRTRRAVARCLGQQGNRPGIRVIFEIRPDGVMLSINYRQWRGGGPAPVTERQLVCLTEAIETRLPRATEKSAYVVDLDPS